VITLFQPELLLARGKFHTGAGLLVDQNGVVLGIRGIEESANRSPDLPPDTVMVRLPGKALLAGFVNAHSHSFQRLIRGRTESRRSGGRDFWSWRGAMYHAAASLSPEQIYHVARMCFLEMALAGTTAVGEFHYLHRTPEGNAYPNANLLAHQVMAAAKSVGIRIGLLRTAYQRAGFELPPDPGQIRFVESTQEFLGNLDDLRRRYHSSEAWIGVAPHSVRAVPIEDIAKLAEYARENHLPLHMHVSEQKAELAACQREYGTSPVRLLARHGVLDNNFTAVHAIHIDPEEMDLLAAKGATICSCPTTERNLGDGIFPAHPVMERGIRVAFGSDSQAQIEPLEDARELEYHLRLQHQQRSVLDGIDGQELPARLFACATANGAAALHCPAGDLATGKLADFFTVDLNHHSIAGNDPEHLLAMIVFGLQRSAISDVVAGGKFLIRNHFHSEQEEIVNQYQEVARQVWLAPQLAAD
jgi:formimidoylglutamate deiminase